MRALAIVALMSLTTLTPASAADVEANKQLFRNLIEDVWNKRQPFAVERYLAPNFIEHNANLPPGLAGRIQFVTSVQAAFSDYHAEIQDIVAEGDRLVCPRAVDRDARRPVPGQARDRQQAAFLHRRLFSHRERQGCRALGCRRQPAPGDCARSRARADAAKPAGRTEVPLALRPPLMSRKSGFYCRCGCRSRGDARWMGPWRHRPISSIGYAIRLRRRRCCWSPKIFSAIAATSARDCRATTTFLIQPFDQSRAELRPEHLLVCGMDGRQRSGPADVRPAVGGLPAFGDLQGAGGRPGHRSFPP